MKRLTRSTAVLLALIFIQAACKHTPKNQAMDIDVARSAVERFSARQKPELPLSGQLHIRQGGLSGVVMQADVDTVLAEDDQYYFSVQSPFSQPLKVLTIAGQRVQLLDLVDGIHFFEGQLNDNTMGLMLPIPLTLEEMRAILLSDIPDTWVGSNTLPHVEGARLKFSAPEKPGRIYELIIDPDGHIIFWRFIDGDTTVVEIEQVWQPVKPSDDVSSDKDTSGLDIPESAALPKSWNITSDYYNSSFSMKNKGLKPHAGMLNPFLFSQTPPAGVEVQPL